MRLGTHPVIPITQTAKTEPSREFPDGPAIRRRSPVLDTGRMAALILQPQLALVMDNP